MHPLVGDLSNVKDSELEQKIFDLTKKYFMTSNFEVQSQMSMVLDSYKTELNKRRQAALEKMLSDKNLDKLIRVS
jgi:hypothetical protein